MKKQSFNNRVAKIEAEATAFIEQLFTGKKRVINLCKPDDESIYDMPDCAIYHKYGFVDWANIFKIKKGKIITNEKKKDIIAVYCIARESGNEETMYLHELDGIHIINLASYFQE